MTSRTALGETERELLRRSLDAHERVDIDALVTLLRDDVRSTMPPALWWIDGRDAVAALTRTRSPSPTLLTGGGSLPARTTNRPRRSTGGRAD
jgi:hypothetical protein